MSKNKNKNRNRIKNNINGKKVTDNKNIVKQTNFIDMTKNKIDFIVKDHFKLKVNYLNFLLYLLLYFLVAILILLWTGQKEFILKIAGMDKIDSIFFAVTKAVDIDKIMKNPIPIPLIIFFVLSIAIYFCKNFKKRNTNFFKNNRHKHVISVLKIFFIMCIFFLLLLGKTGFILVCYIGMLFLLFIIFYYFSINYFMYIFTVNMWQLWLYYFLGDEDLGKIYKFAFETFKNDILYFAIGASVGPILCYIKYRKKRLSLFLLVGYVSFIVPPLNNLALLIMYSILYIVIIFLLMQELEPQDKTENVCLTLFKAIVGTIILYSAALFFMNKIGIFTIKVIALAIYSL